MKKSLFLLAVAGGLVTLGATAYAQFNKPEDAIRYRQSALFLMGNHMGRINAQLKSPNPDVQVIQRSAAIVEVASKLPYEAFIPGTETGGNPATRAKPEVFKDTEKFKSLAEKMQGEVVKLSAAAKSGDINAIRAQFGETGKACKACHDDYRKDL
ncbi:MAG TPA: cytochrome c [Burkholderiaceae bacterium]|nr:cytochrome c [Burkholderiaceae bacterium]